MGRKISVKVAEKIRAKDYNWKDCWAPCKSRYVKKRRMLKKNKRKTLRGIKKEMLKEAMEEFERWREKNCPQVIGGSGIGDCNCCPYPVCEEFFNKKKEGEMELKLQVKKFRNKEE